MIVFYFIIGTFFFIIGLLLGRSYGFTKKFTVYDLKDFIVFYNDNKVMLDNFLKDWDSKKIIAKGYNVNNSLRVAKWIIKRK